MSQRTNVPQPTFSFPMYVAPPFPSQLCSSISPLDLLTAHQNILRLHQLQKAFQFGLEQKKPRCTSINQIAHFEQGHDENHAKTELLSDEEKLKNTSKVQAHVISQWDPWFHRRIRKSVQEHKKIVKRTKNVQSKKRLDRTGPEYLTSRS